MSVAGTQLNTDLPVTLLHGDADLLMQRAARQFVEEALDEAEREYGLIRIDADEVGLAGIVAEMQSGSLMAPRRVVAVHSVTALTNREQRDLALRIAEPTAGLTLVLIAEKPAGERRYGVPVAADLRRAIEAVGQIVQLNTPREGSLPGWAVDEMQAQGKDLRRDAAAMLCQNVSNDLDRLMREIEKLASYVGDRDVVTVEDVQAVSVRVTEADIFELMDAIGRKDARTALMMLDGVLPEGSERGEFIPFLGMISRQIRLIWQARYLRQCKIGLKEIQNLPEEIAARLPERHNFVDATSGRKSWLVEKFTKQAAMFSDGQLARAIDRVCKADLALKGGGGRLDERTVIELLIADLCR